MGIYYEILDTQVCMLPLKFCMTIYQNKYKKFALLLRIKHFNLEK